MKKRHSHHPSYFLSTAFSDELSSIGNRVPFSQEIHSCCIWWEAKSTPRPCVDSRVMLTLCLAVWYWDKSKWFVCKASFARQNALYFVLLPGRREQRVIPIVGHPNLSRFPYDKVNRTESNFAVSNSCCVKLTFKLPCLFKINSAFLLATPECRFLVTEFPLTDIKSGCNAKDAISI